MTWEVIDVLQAARHHGLRCSLFFITQPEKAMSSMPMTSLLRFALLLDAAASAATGLLLVAGHELLSPLLGLPVALLLGAGLVSLPYALGLFLLARRERIPAGLGWAVIGFNALWAVESVGILVLGWVQPSTWGLAFVLAQAAAVVVFAELQWWGMRRGRVAHRAALA